MLFEQAWYLARFRWPDFLGAFADQPYVQYQPPCVTFWYSRLPVFWLHQVVMFPFGLLCAGLMGRLYGRPAALLLATPVCALMIHQPCSDTVLFGLLLITQRLIQMGKPHPRPNPKEGKAITFSEKGCHCEESATKQSPDTGEIASQSLAMTLPLRQNVIALLPVGEVPGKRFRLLAAVVYGLTWPVKPLTLLTAPFMLPQLGWPGLLSVGMWTGYVIWSLRWPFGRRQAAFLLHQLLIRSMARRPSGPPPPPRPPRPVWAWLAQSLRWRWEHLGRPAVRALPFYLCPAYLRPWRWAGGLLTLMIVLGYGNLKYLMLSLLWVFPMIEEE